MVQKILMKDGRKTLFHNQRPGKDWYYAFLLRNEDVALRKPESIGKERAVLTVEKVNQWFTELQEHFSSEVDGGLSVFDDPSRILNGDESGFLLCFQSGRVLAETSAKHVYGVASGNRQQLTV